MRSVLSGLKLVHVTFDRLAKNQASFVHDRVRRGVGLFLI